MIIVRDKTQSIKGYKGHPCYATDKVCPCRTCFNCHDCTPPSPCHSKKMYSDVFQCATNYNRGCPDPKPQPKHISTKYGKVCKRCGLKQ